MIGVTMYRIITWAKQLFAGRPRPQTCILRGVLSTVHGGRPTTISYTITAHSPAEAAGEIYKLLTDKRAGDHHPDLLAHRRIQTSLNRREYNGHPKNAG